MPAASATTTSSSRSCAGWAMTPRRRSPLPAAACAPTARSATSWPAWPTWSAACSRTPPTIPSSPRTPAASTPPSSWRPRDRRRSPGGSRRCKYSPGGLALAGQGGHEMTPFANEPLLQLRRGAVRAEALQALAALDAKLPLEVPMLIGDDVVHGHRFASVDPSNPTIIVAHAHAATAEHAREAIARAEHGQKVWSRKPAGERAAALRRAAEILRSKRQELAALAVREAGKPWAEADGDICEAIDFLEYYAAGALALDGGKPLLQLPGERNAMRYVPRGVTGVIAPWNFPLAIAAGMVSAALATGNAVVLKPAEQAPACAKAVVDALHAGGVPLDALSLLPGGDEPGKALVADPRIHTIVFTGSCAAGLNILETAAKVVPGQRHIKRVIAEMGGKNCVIVDSDRSEERRVGEGRRTRGA